MQVFFTKNQRIFQLIVIQGRKNAVVALEFDHKDLHLGLNYHWGHRSRIRREVVQSCGSLLFEPCISS